MATERMTIPKSTERPYVCPECGKAFQYRNALSGHLGAHVTKRLRGYTAGRKPTPTAPQASRTGEAVRHGPIGWTACDEGIWIGLDVECAPWTAKVW